MRRELPPGGRAAGWCVITLGSLVLLSDHVGSADQVSRPAAVAPASGMAEPAARETRKVDAPSTRIEENAGQADPEVLFLARGARFTALFLAHGIELFPGRPERSRRRGRADPAVVRTRRRGGSRRRSDPRARAVLRRFRSGPLAA